MVTIIVRMVTIVTMVTIVIMVTMVTMVIRIRNPVAIAAQAEWEAATHSASMPWGDRWNSGSGRGWNDFSSTAGGDAWSRANGWGWNYSSWQGSPSGESHSARGKILAAERDKGKRKFDDMSPADQQVLQDFETNELAKRRKKIRTRCWIPKRRFAFRSERPSAPAAAEHSSASSTTEEDETAA